MDWTRYYRPKTLDLVIGQDHITNALSKLFENEDEIPHTFLLHGPSGVGKTTIARIIGNALGCTKEPNRIEINASSKNSVDDMRELERDMMYKAQGPNKRKFYIFDEAHQITTQAFQVLLKPIEEPPNHVYFVFVTTEPSKIPRTIETRCNTFKFDDVSSSDIILLLELVNEEEDLKLDKYLKLIARAAYGSPRKALNAMSICRGLTSKEEVLKALETVDEESTIIEFCNCLAPYTDSYLQDALVCLRKLSDKNPETIRIIVLNYFSKAIFREKKLGNNFDCFLSILNAFNTTPLNKSTGMAELILATSEAFLGG